jgi:zinc protease
MNARITTATAALFCLLGAASCAGTPPPPPAAPPPAPAAAGPAAPAAIPHRYALAAGPHKVVLPHPGDPLISIRLLFRTGSADDPPGLEGATALAAQVMAEGGTRSLSAAELQTALFPMAAELRVQVDKEITVFIARVHKDHLDRFLPILTDVLLHPRWEQREMDRLRADFINDVSKRLRTGDDETLGKEALSALLYGGLPGQTGARHPYGSYVGGSVEGLRKLTLADLQRQAARMFTRLRLCIGVAGGVSGPDDPIVTRLEQALVPADPQSGGLPEGDKGDLLPAGIAPPALPATRVLLVDKEASSTAVSMGFPYELGRRDPDFFAMMVANSAFGEHRQFGGRLFERLRGKRGLNYGDYSYLEYFAQDGYSTFGLPNLARQQQNFTIWLRPVENKNRLFAIRAALFELDRLVKGGLTADELEKTKGFLLGYTRLWEQTMSRRLGYALDDLYYGTPSPGLLARFRERLASLTLKEVNAAIRRHLDPSKIRIVVVTSGAAQLGDAMVKGTPSPISYATPPHDKVQLAEDAQIETWPLGVTATDVRVVPASALFER